MRLAYITYKAKDIYKSANLFVQAFNYRLAEETLIKENDSDVKRLRLSPPEAINKFNVENPPTSMRYFFGVTGFNDMTYDLAPDIYIIESNDKIGIDSLGYQCKSAKAAMNLMKEKGLAEFITDNPVSVDGSVQIQTLPSTLTGITYIFVE